MGSFDLLSSLDSDEQPQQETTVTDTGVTGARIENNEEDTNNDQQTGRLQNSDGLIGESRQTSMTEEEDAPPTVFKPTKPKIGGIFQSKRDEFVIWTGGKPKADWKGLDPTARQEYLRALQVRTFNDKRFKDRVTGPEDKFDKKKGDFSRLKDDIEQHLVMHGMDSIAYLRNPLDPTEMLFIVTEHPKYTPSKVKELMDVQMTQYDQYDRNNDVSARDFLLDCLEKGFRREVQDQARDVKSFPELFMVLVKIVTHDSPQHWEQVKKDMRGLLPQKYPGQDIMALTKDFSQKARPLIAAGLYDHTLTASLMTNILRAEWPDTPKFELMYLAKNLNDTIIEVRFQDRTTADLKMRKEKLWYTDIIETANTKYLVSVKDGEWRPKQHATDSKAPPTSFGANKAIAKTTPSPRQNRSSGHKGAMTQASLNALINSLKHPPGHNPTPSPSTGPRNPSTGHRDKGGKKKPQHKKNMTRVDRSKVHPWRLVPPASHEPESMIVDGVMYYWCAICKRWNDTHGTAKHIVGYKKNKHGTKESRAHKLEFDVSAWKTEFDCCVLCHDQDCNTNDWKDLPDCMSLEEDNKGYTNTQDFDLCAFVMQCDFMEGHGTNMIQHPVNNPNFDHHSADTSSLEWSSHSNKDPPQNQDETNCCVDHITEERKTEGGTPLGLIVGSGESIVASDESFPSLPPLVRRHCCEKRCGSETEAEANTLYFDEWEDINSWYDTSSKNQNMDTDLSMAIQTVEANTAAHEASFDSSQLNLGSDDTHMRSHNTTMSSILDTTQDSSVLSDDNISMTPLKNLQRGEIASGEEQEDRKPAAMQPDISPIQMDHTSPPRLNLQPRPSVRTLEEWARSFQPGLRPPATDPRISIEEEAAKARRDGMRYERAQYTVYALQHQEPKLTIAQAYQRVKNEEWYLGWYLDGTRIPHHPNPAPVWPGLEIQSDPPPCLLRARIMEHRPIERGYHAQFVALLNQSNATPSPVNISDPPSVNLSSRSKACETLEQQAEDMADTADGERSFSSTSFVDTSNLGEQYVPTDASHTTNETDITYPRINPFAQYYAKMALIEIADSDSSSDDEEMTDANENLESEDEIDENNESPFVSLCDSIIQYLTCVPHSITVIHNVLGKHGFDQDPDKMDVLLTNATEELVTTRLAFNRESDPATRGELEIKLHNQGELVKELWIYTHAREQVEGSPYSNRSLPLTLIHEFAWDLAAGDLAPDIPTPVCPDRVRSDGSSSTVYPSQSQTPRDSPSKDFPDFDQFEMNYAPYSTFSDTTPGDTRGPTRVSNHTAPVGSAQTQGETTTISPFPWHMFAASFTTLLVVLSSILWILPAPHPLEHANNATISGFKSIWSGMTHLYLGIRDLTYGGSALVWSVLIHPSCQPAFFTWLCCWLAAFMVAPWESPSVAHTAPIRSLFSPQPQRPSAVHHFRVNLHPRRHAPPPLFGNTLLFHTFWCKIVGSILNGRVLSDCLRLIVVSVGKLLLSGRANRSKEGEHQPLSPRRAGPKRKRKSVFQPIHPAPVTKRARMRTRLTRVNRPSLQQRLCQQRIHSKKRRNPQEAYCTTPIDRYQNPHRANHPSNPMNHHRNRNSNNRPSTNPVDIFRNTRSAKEREMFALAACLEGPTLCDVFRTLGSTPHHQWEQITQAGLQACLQDPLALRSAMPHNASYPIIWDSGASISITNQTQDFIGTIQPLPNFNVKGIANRMKATGRGFVLWSVLDTEGKLRQLKLPAFLVPKTNARLLSTQSLLQTYDGEKIIQDGKTMVLTGMPGDKKRTQITILINPSNNLPMSYGYDHKEVKKSAHALSSIISETSQHNMNLSEAQQELVRWHNRFGHLSFRKVQFVMRTGVLATSEHKRRLHIKASTLTNLPLCAACQYGKQKRRPSPGTTSSIVKDRKGITKAENLYPGQCVSVDHFVCSTKGRRFNTQGSSASKDMYMGGAIFVDHASGYTWIGFQSHLNTHETLHVKNSFELFCRDVGVMPSQYLTDNGSAFTSAKYTESLQTFAQTYRFAGVGAHHHAGIAERAIQTIMSIARTMMLHAAIHWPEMADPSLWPMAVSHATFLCNHVPNTATGISPHDLFTRTRWEQRKFHDLHVWGCPVYVLDKSMSDGKKLPRWKPRSTRCILMGLSNRHATTVPLVLNPSTGYITPQFHVVFDDWFSTIATSVEDVPDFTSTEWDQLFGESRYQYTEDETEENMESPTATDEVHRSKYENRLDHIHQSMDRHIPDDPLPIPTPPTLPPVSSHSAPVAEPTLPSEGVPHTPVAAPLPQRENTVLTPIAEQDPPSPPVMTPLKSATPKREQPPPEPTPPSSFRTSRRSGRTIRPPQRYVQDANLASLAPSYQPNDLLSMMKASISDPDTLSYDEAMRDNDIDRWKEAAENEIRELEEKGTWTEVPKSEATTRILPGTWVFKRKRSPDGEIRKYKARYCVRGDLQETEEENYSPVVNWSTIRIVLVLSLVLGWELACIDFNNAFVQATLHEPVWIHLPRGFRSSSPGTMCLRLLKSLYGLSSAPRLWYDHLVKALLEDGFQMSKHDKCLLYKKDIIIFLWVDDCGVCAPTMKLVDDLIERLKEKGLSLQKEGNFTDYLGINFVHNEKTKSITMTQKGLINKIIEATGLQDCKPNWTPATQLALGSDPDGEPMQEKWQYRSIVGMLLYLATNTRPDIAFAVSQVARFSTAPKKSHAAAIKTIVRYLVRTKDKGTIFTPTKDFKLDCYVDADFAGLHGREPQDNPVSAKSRTGYILSLSGCPLIWRSQLQSSVALSTLQAEYHALSQAMRSVIATRRVVEELLTNLDLPFEKPTIYSEVFEDNSGAFYLATKQRLTPRTKHFNTYLHFFWEHVGDHPGGTKVSMVSTEEQRADYFTKCQARDLFERCRKLNQGW